MGHGFALLLLNLLQSEAPQPADRCAPLFPRELRAAVARKFPGSRLPEEEDSSPEDLRYRVEHGGNGCLAAAPGDFDGDGNPDLAFLSTQGGGVFLMVGFSGPKGWKVERVWMAGRRADRPRLFVEVVDAGKYDDVGLEDEMEHGQVTTFTCSSQVVMTGLLESATVAFCKSRNGWAHVWMSD
jgi:hypothetical protein